MQLKMDKVTKKRLNLFFVQLNASVLLHSNYLKAFLNYISGFSAKLA